MSERLITLTTDFGEGSSYVAAMKGVILGINPNVRIVDVSHRIPPQDIRHAEWFLRFSLPWFPSETIHVIVVDPGVGTKRKLLLIRAGTHWLLAPDNGCWILAAARAACAILPPPHLKGWQISNREYWLPHVSRTFHGRDILAPVAAHLSLGVKPDRFGPLVSDWVEAPETFTRINDSQIKGEVIFIDPFGNVMTGIDESALRSRAFVPPIVRIGRHRVARFVKTYGDAEVGETVALIGSEGYVEVAVVNGNAAEKLGVKVGAAVVVTHGPKQKKA